MQRTETGYCIPFCRDWGVHTLLLPDKGGFLDISQGGRGKKFPG